MTNFPFRDFTNQYISLSYQSVVQTYTQGTASYLLDGLGNALLFIPTSSVGQQVITADQPIASSSYALTASFALNGGGGGGSSVSSSWASASISASYASTADSLNGWNFTNTSSNVNVLSSDVPVVDISTGSYSAAFFDYVALSGSNTRAGIVFGSWVNGLINYTEVSNVDVGDTSKVTMSLALNGGNVQLLANVSDTTPWNIKALGRYL